MLVLRHFLTISESLYGKPHYTGLFPTRVSCYHQRSFTSAKKLKLHHSNLTYPEPVQVFTIAIKGTIRTGCFKASQGLIAKNVTV